MALVADSAGQRRYLAWRDRRLISEEHYDGLLERHQPICGTVTD